MPAQIPEVFDHNGIVLYRSALAGRKLVDWKSQIDECYGQIEAARQHGDSAAVAQLIGPSEQFAPTASSFTIGTALSDENLRNLLSTLTTGCAGAWIESTLRSHVSCDLDQSWVRRQYAPSRYPPFHAPHGWHQDGALKFDFSSYPDGNFPADAMLNMVTCWIALNACGADAPGIEFISEELAGLLQPAELGHDAIQAQFAPAKFCRPTLEPGDALLFRGGLLHRTHVTPAMTKDRTSIELRFFAGDEVPQRLKSDRFFLLS
jgi:hypothetical protein